jgi:hypothetical protein
MILNNGGIMKTWITTIGHQPMAAVNTLWAVFQEEEIGVIDKLVVLFSKDMKKNVDIFKDWAEILFKEYQDGLPEFELLEFPKDDIRSFRNLLKQTVNKTERAQNITERLNTAIRFRKREMTLADIINFQGKSLASFLTGKIPSYKPFIGKW